MGQDGENQSWTSAGRFHIEPSKEHRLDLTTELYKEPDKPVDLSKPDGWRYGYESSAYWHTLVEAKKVNNSMGQPTKWSKIPVYDAPEVNDETTP